MGWSASVAKSMVKRALLMLVTAAVCALGVLTWQDPWAEPAKRNCEEPPSPYFWI